MKTTAAIASVAVSLLATSALAAPRALTDAQMSQVVAGGDFAVTIEVSDTVADGGLRQDPSLSNPWGLAQGQGTFLWVSDNNTGVSTLYDPSGALLGMGPFAKAGLTVNIPDGAADPKAPPSPTGAVFTDFGASTFQVTQGGVTSHALFLFGTEDGTISGWSLGFPDLTHAEIAVDDSSTHASFKGLAILDPSATPASATLYAADFANNRVDVFNDQFQPVTSFTDHHLPPGFAPFNVQQLNGLIYVTFAKFNPVDTEGLPRPGAGFVDVYNPATGSLTRLISGDHLDAPWGLDIAPANFGKFAGDLLVGNFGDGRIHAYNPTTGQFEGTVDLTGKANGGPGSFRETDLWSLQNGPDGEVIFSAGLTGQNGGVLGVVTPAAAAASWAYQSHVRLGH